MSMIEIFAKNHMRSLQVMGQASNCYFTLLVFLTMTFQTFYLLTNRKMF